MLKKCQALLLVCWAMGIALSAQPAFAAAPPASDEEPLPPGVKARLGTSRLRHPKWPRIAFSADGKSLISWCSERFCVWDVRTGRMRDRMRFGGERVWDITPSGLVFTTADDARLSVWSVKTGKRLWTCRAEQWKSHPFGFVSPTARLFVPTEEHEVSILDTRTGRTVKTLRGFDLSVDGEFSPDEDFLAMRDGLRAHP